MAAHAETTLLFLFFLCILCCLVDPAYANQYDLTTPANISQGGTVWPYFTDGCFYNDGTRVSLLAVPNAGYIFESWSGDCTGNNPSASVNMTAPRTCTANFSSCPDLPVKRGAKLFGTFLEAYTAAIGDTTIRMLATNLQESFGFDLPLAITLSGGYTCGYAGNSSFTLIQGQLIVNSGIAIVENLIILSSTPTVISAGVAYTATLAPGEVQRYIFTSPPGGCAPWLQVSLVAMKTMGGDGQLLVKSSNQRQSAWPTVDDYDAIFGANGYNPGRDWTRDPNSGVYFFNFINGGAGEGVAIMPTYSGHPEWVQADTYYVLLINAGASSNTYHTSWECL